MSTLHARRPIAGLVGVSALIALIAAGCAGWPGNRGDAAAPIVATGTVLNKYGTPYSGADLVLQAVDAQGEPVVEGASLVLNERFSSRFDGTFELRVAPSDALARLAAANGGIVHFKLTASHPGESRIPPAEFSRQLAGSDWVGTAPVLEMRTPPPPPTAPPPTPAPSESPAA